VGDAFISGYQSLISGSDAVQDERWRFVRFSRGLTYSQTFKAGTGCLRLLKHELEYLLPTARRLFCA
jgi:hypothetical protein